MLNEFWKSVGGDKVQLWTPDVSSFSKGFSGLTIYLLSFSLFFSLLIFCLLAYFAIRYRSRPGREMAEHVESSYALEIFWTLVPLAIVLVAFYWGGRQYLKLQTPPGGAEQVFVVGKQWMWKIHHENGLGEINALHVPAERDVELLMISEDVIHSFFAPDFRVKFDVLPGRYTHAWFRATKPGSYSLLCTQFCGTDHSLMIGSIDVLSADDYAAWVREQRLDPLSGQGSSIERGRHLYASHSCGGCHGDESKPPSPAAPSLAGLYGSEVFYDNEKPGAKENSGIADFNYLRQSILNPSAHVVDGYKDVMPSFAGQLKEEELIDLIDYLKTFSGPKVALGKAGERK